MDCALDGGVFVLCDKTYAAVTTYIADSLLELQTALK